MKLLHIIPSINPKLGGPVEGVKQRGVKLLEMGHVVEVVCLDDKKEPYLKDFPLLVYALGSAKTSYGYSNKLIPWLSKHAKQYDAVIVNGIWMYHSYAAWKALHDLKVPYYVFTHGMLDPWFKYTYPLKHIKKVIYWHLFEHKVLRDAQAVLFTCEQEKHLAAQSFSKYQVNPLVVKYGTAKPPQNQAGFADKFIATYPELKDKRILLFLSRVHEKKGCDLLIRAFAQAAKDDLDLHLMIAGPASDDYLKKLKLLSVSLGVEDKITWTGMLKGNDKWAAFYASDAFILPSHQENFGIVVAEALGCGLPVLISNKVNIWLEIVNSGAGLVEDDTLDGTISNIEKWLKLSKKEKENMKRSASLVFDELYTVDAMATSLINVVRNCCIINK